MIEKRSVSVFVSGEALRWMDRRGGTSGGAILLVDAVCVAGTRTDGVEALPANRVSGGESNERSNGGVQWD